MKKNILIVDDNKDILYTIEQICIYQQWNVLMAKDYYSCMEIVDNNKIDIILVDYHLPKVDGITVVTEIRKKLPKIPIIVLTVEERENVMNSFIKAGANDYSLKPIKAIDLISRISVHINHSEKERFFNDSNKGISKVTLKTIVDYLTNINVYNDIETISANTNIKLKTLYRYLHYLQENNSVDVKYDYQAVGRPKTYYKIL